MTDDVAWAAEEGHQIAIQSFMAGRPGPDRHTPITIRAFAARSFFFSSFSSSSLTHTQYTAAATVTHQQQ